MGMIPKSTKQENKLHNGISFGKIAGLIAVIVVCATIINPLFFHGVLVKILFTVYCSAVYIIAVKRSPTDPTKPFIVGLKDWIFFALQPRTIYGESSEEYEEHKRRQEKNEADKQRKQEKKAEKKQKKRDKA